MKQGVSYFKYYILYLHKYLILFFIYQCHLIIYFNVKQNKMITFILNIFISKKNICNY